MLSLDKTISVVPTQGTQLAVKYYYLLPIRHISTPTQLSTLSSCTVMSGHATVTKPKKKILKMEKRSRRPNEGYITKTPRTVWYDISSRLRSGGNCHNIAR